MSKELEEIGGKIVGRIKEEFDSKNLNDTKLGQGSVTYKVVGSNLSIEAFKRVLLLQEGREPDPNYNEDSWKEIYPAIEGWVRRKIAPPEEEVFITTKFIADKIQREGTSILRDRSKGLELEIILEEYLNQIATLVTEKETENVVNQIVKLWQ